MPRGENRFCQYAMKWHEEMGLLKFTDCGSKNWQNIVRFVNRWHGMPDRRMDQPEAQHVLANLSCHKAAYNEACGK